MKCTWSGGGYLEIDLHHCTDPVNYHVYLNAPGKGISKNITLQKGDDKELFQNFRIHVTELSRKGNMVTTTVSFTFVTVECKLFIGFNMIIIINNNIQTRSSPYTRGLA